MTFDEVLDQVRELLQQRGRVTYRALKLRYQLDDELLAGVADELISAERVAVDEDGKVLVWVGREPTAETENRSQGKQLSPPTLRLKDSRRAEGERRQLTVLFCDLVGSTTLSEQLDPEELRAVVQAYQQTCAAVIRRYEGHIAQYLGDGLLVYFGYPVAHEDNAQRAVRTGLEIIAALQYLSARQKVPSPLVGEGQGEGEKNNAVSTPHPNSFDQAQDRLPLQGGKELRRLHVRIGIHTGVVVIGDMGTSERREILALGETPNIAARLQGLAEPDTVVVSAATQRLVAGLFECQDLGLQTLKGLSTPMAVYQVVREGEAHSRFEAAVSKGLTPLVGREEELGLLRRRWEQAKAGVGHVVLLSGEPGIGKSRLVQELKEQVSAAGATRIEFRCSPYHQNSAFYPIIDHLQRLLRFARNDPPEEKPKKLENARGGAHGRAPLHSIAIPATLQDSLMARLDRLGSTKEIAQLGATIGREFSYELLHAVSPVGDETLQHGLKQLVEVELVYQRGVVPQTTYLFKHALIQDTAYQSLLKSKRQQLHQQIARVLEAQFPETQETQPELVAHHYTEAGLAEPAISYWQQAGQKAVAHSANAEAINHLSKGLELLQTLPETPERVQQELALQMALGAPLTATKGTAAREVGEAYARARKLCQQLGETPQLFPVLRGLWLFYIARAEHQTARELAEQCLRLAQSARDPALLLEAQYMLGNTLFYFGEFAPAREHFEQSTALYNFGQHHSHAFLYGQDTGVVCLARAAWVIYFLGYPDQALKLSYQAIILAQELSHPHSLAYALGSVATLHQLRREGQAAQEQAEAAMTLSTEQGFLLWVAWGTMLRGWALAKQERAEEGTSQIRQGIATFRATGAEVSRPYLRALLAEAYERAGQVEEGLSSLAAALAAVDNGGERWYEAELYRLKGELTLQQFQVQGSKFKVEDRLGSSVQRLESEAEECFLKAIEIAQRQQAKSLELRAVMSLVRLRQRQAILPASRDTDHATRDTQHETRTMLAETHTMLADVYNWFTEGFDTKDLQETKALIEELNH
jgi:class 3 adenylate cyclase/predicted ATPase